MRNRLRKQVSHNELIDLLHYDPTSGAFYWKKTRGHSIAGAVAGSIGSGGYRRITIAKTPYLAHRLAWLFIHGESPVGWIDHINGDRDDNRAANLRDVTPQQNASNRGHRTTPTIKSFPTWIPPQSDTALTAHIVRSLLLYEPESGVFTWRKRAGKYAAGTVAGYLLRDGYRMIRITVGGKQHHCFAARLAWLYIHGRMPDREIDHVNCDRSDDRIANLREANRRQNLANTRGWSGRDGIKGVRKRHSKWVARLAGKHLGTFATPEEAQAAYFSELTRLYGEFARAA